MTVWNITITAPTGAFDATLNIRDEGDGPTGEMNGKNSTGPMQNLTLGPSTIAWATKIERPMPMKLTFKGDHDGEVLSGTVKFGMFASGTFTGTRAG
jgi:hypothetical protein